MVPQTALAVVAFILLIVPGIVFELLRQTQRPAFEQTALEEVARILVASIALGAAACSLLALVDVWADNVVVDISGVAAHGVGWYWSRHPGRVIATVGCEVVAATVLGVLVHRSLNAPDKKGFAQRALTCGERFLRHKPTGQIVRFPVWWTVFRHARPSDAVTKLTVVKKDGTLVTGTLAAYSTGGANEERDVALHQPIEVLRPGATAIEEVPPGWKVMVISASEITEILVTWPPATEAIPSPPVSTPSA